MDLTNALRLARSTVSQEADSLRELAESLDDRLWEAARRIAECSGIVWVTGVGTSAAVGERCAHILTDCGVRSVFLSPDLGLHGHSGVMAASEVLVAISRGGESVDVNEMAAIATARSLETIAFVDNEASSLARICRLVLPVHSPPEYELGGYCATTSTVVCSALCDAVCAVVLKLKGYTFEQFSPTHPGGAVGQARLKRGPNTGDSE